MQTRCVTHFMWYALSLLFGRFVNSNQNISISWKYIGEIEKNEKQNTQVNLNLLPLPTKIGHKTALKKKL